MQKYLDELGSEYRKSLQVELKDFNEYQDKLRVSGFPFCGLKYFWEKINVEIHGKRNLTNSFKEYFTTSGTAMHLIFQRWLGFSNKIIGNWQCKCGFYRKISKNNICSVCKEEMQYEEITVNYQLASGHIDGIFMSKSGKLFVIDYKTTSLHVLKSNLLPYAKNVAQIKSYCAMFENQYDIKISGWMLIYVARDHINKFVIKGDYISTKEKEVILKRIALFSQQYRLCKDVYLLNKSDLSWLIETKTCKDRAYLKKFFTFGCPLESVCFTDNLFKIVKDTHSMLNNKKPKD